MEEFKNNNVTSTSGTQEAEEIQKMDAVQVAREKEMISLADILDKKADSSVIFNRYRDKSEIAKKIAKVLFTKKYNSGKDSVRGGQRRSFERGFYNTDIDRSQVGLLTQCLGLQATASLSDFGLDMSAYSGIIDHTLNDIFGQMGFDSEKYEKIVAMGNDIKFDTELLSYNMTPYVKAEYSDDDDDDALVVNTCVESACNVLKALAEARDMIIIHENNGIRLELTFENKPIDPQNMVKMTEYLIKYTVAWICSACIPAKRTIHYVIGGKKAANSLMGYLGWNFFKITNSQEDYEPSLYMTYSACSAYISLLQSVKEVRENESKKVKVDAPTYIYRENERLYNLIRDDFALFQKQCISAGRYEEMRSNGMVGGKEIDLASKFIGQNYAEVDFEDIQNSTTNDAVINTVLHVLILLYSGIDMDYDIVGRSDEFFDEIQYTLQNILRCYKYLLKEDKTYIIEQYYLSFKEKMPSTVTALAKILRRQRIQVTSLLPLLIRAYNEVSRYLIKYPQKQNVEYLRMIMDNRTDTDKGKEWAWDKDGYNITSENYFIKALRSFYEYYEEYEECYIAPEETLKIEREKITKETDSKIEAIKSEWAQNKEELEKIIVEKDRRIKDLTSTREPLINEVIALVEETIQKNLGRYISDLLEKDIAGKFNTGFSDEIKKYVVMRYCGESLENRGYKIDDTVINAADKHIKGFLNKALGDNLNGDGIQLGGRK